MSNPIMTVAAECSYTTNNTSERARCNAVIEAARDSHPGETCETRYELSSDHATSTLTLMCNGEAGRELNQKIRQSQSEMLQSQRELAQTQRDISSFGILPLIRWAQSML